MTITRIYTGRPLETGNHIDLEAAASHHISHVLRLKEGTELRLFNGNGFEFQAIIKNIGKSGVRVALGQSTQPRRESNLHITLVQGISRGERMDFTLQKSVELGVNRIVPIWAQRTQVRLEGQRLEKRLQRWHGIIRSACEQSGRLVLPKLDAPVTCEDWCKSDTGTGSHFILDPEATRKLGDIKSVANKLTVLIGPEGGFDSREIDIANRQGFSSISLGPRILRTETAAISALSAIQTLWGDLG